MFELRIIGETPAALLANAREALAVFATAQATMPAAAVAEDKFPKSDNVGAETVAEPLENPRAGGKGKPGRKPKPAAIDLTANKPVEALPEADFLDESDEPAVEVTVDQCKDAVRQALENAKKRAEAAIPNFASLKGKDLEKANLEVQKATVAYVKPLLQKFEAANVSSLKPEQYGAFVKAAQAFIDGEA